MWRRMTRQLLLSDDSRRPTALVIRALGMIVGKMVRDDRDISDVSDSSDVSTKRHVVLTSLITAASQKFLNWILTWIMLLAEE